MATCQRQNVSNCQKMADKKCSITQKEMHQTAERAILILIYVVYLADVSSFSGNQLRLSHQNIWEVMWCDVAAFYDEKNDSLMLSYLLPTLAL